MPLVEVNEVMPVPVDRSWELINRLESYADVMEHVRAMEVLERGPHHRVSAWEVDLKGCVMRWVEHETFDSEKYRIEYRQLEGDLEEFEGYWQLHPLTEESSRVVLAVQFEIGVPMLSEMLDPIAESAIADNSRAMLASLAAHAHGPVR
jgi:ribosome-associated toxin RatA of RatAB toxin-antitoxin module